MIKGRGSRRAAEDKLGKVYPLSLCSSTTNLLKMLSLIELKDFFSITE